MSELATKTMRRPREGEIPRDGDKAVGLFAKACAQHDSTGCNNVGHMYELGHGVAQDDAKAAGYYKRACDAGLALGCTNLGQMQQAGRAKP